MANCTQASHEAMKRDDALWLEGTTFPVGHLERPVIGDEEGAYEMANCLRCHSTLARPIEIERKQAVH